MLLANGKRSIVIDVTVSQAALYNLFTAAGSPIDAVDVLVTIQTGKVLTKGFTTGGPWHAETTLRLVNNGISAGVGGDGTGGIFGSGGFATAGTLSEGEDGQAGGHGVIMLHNLTIDNTNGFIYGGGGQGGGGGAIADTNPPAGNAASGGGGGGGGRGYNNAAGGAKGQGNTDGHDGNPGSSSAAGTGGTGGLSFAGTGGTGGTGGDWGTAGSAGSLATATAANRTAVGPGGAAGKAVQKNSHTLTWQGGNNSTQVKGAQT